MNHVSGAAWEPAAFQWFGWFKVFVILLEKETRFSWFES